MRILIISDVHSNIEGLEAVFRDAGARGGFDAVWCLGDIVGYGADPARVIAALRRDGAQIVAGNHDLAAAGSMGTQEFNPIAAAAIDWTRAALDDEQRSFLRALPKTLAPPDFSLVHGSLRAPEWEYLLDAEAAAAQFALQPTPFSAVGHSHVQFWCEERVDEPPRFHAVSDGEQLTLGDGRLIVNPGSAGQPRDGDPRAAYLLYDDDARTLTWRRIEYDIPAAARKIVDAGLPRFLAERLFVGR